MRIIFVWSLFCFSVFLEVVLSHIQCVFETPRNPAQKTVGHQFLRSSDVTSSFNCKNQSVIYPISMRGQRVWAPWDPGHSRNLPDWVGLGQQLPLGDLSAAMNQWQRSPSFPNFSDARLTPNCFEFLMVFRVTFVQGKNKLLNLRQAVFTNSQWMSTYGNTSKSKNKLRPNSANSFTRKSRQILSNCRDSCSLRVPSVVRAVFSPGKVSSDWQNSKV